ncbi:MAG TPA: pyridoxal phosphate-dependent aminotransferase [Candidatus Omnitrophica bacterium]|nr:MAG: aromatic amino acid aminotransferase [Omnitrophica WOR_2 bacterium GWA2_53_43]HBO97426.1 pyridoxal phosphate-dependent aminotransferase [Candidatus Omnitrophota bacterium]HCI44344.1 pyridoxal phosphate-dependent aminotransferase [Candidatus Omnitrophota bacterium]
MIEISKKVEQLAPSGIRAFFDLVLGMKDVISLGVGEPDFVTPWHIREKAIFSLEQGYTSYTSNKGMPELRRQIAAFLKTRYGMNYDFDEEILITVGVSEGLDLAMRAILNPGDKVLVPEPVYVSYRPVVELAGGRAVILKTGIENGFKLTPRQIGKACGKGVKALMINYPCNPTGASYTRAELQAIAQVAKKNKLLIISDEIYDELTYDFDHVPLASLKGMKDSVLYFNGFSKAYAMTGFRIGWVCGPAKVVAAMTKIHQYTMLCAPITGQVAAQEALKSGLKSVQEMKSEYKRRRNYIVRALNEIGLECHMPQGAFYVFPSIKSTGETSMAFAQNLLRKKKVALVPGTAFGPSCEGHVRISYASAYDSLKEAVSRINNYLNSENGQGSRVKEQGKKP